jgi:tetratricopeptide (TPR) repeat protein
LSKLSRVRIGWGTPPVSDGSWWLWLFCLYRRYPDGVRGPDPLHPLTKKAGVACLQLSVRGLLAWTFALGLIAYFGGALALLRWYERMPHNRVSYADLVVPARWSQVSALRGQATIVEAYGDLKAGNFQPGFAKLRFGLARNPADAKARLDLARIYVAIRLRPLAERTVLDAFEHGYPGKQFVRDAFALMAESDHPEQSLLFCKKARATAVEARTLSADLRLIDEMHARTLLEAGRSAEALALVRLHLPAEDEFARDVQVQHLLATKAFDEAVRAVEDWLTQAPGSKEALRLSVRVYREAGRFAEMQEALKRLQTRMGAGPEFASYKVVQHALAAQRVETNAAIEDFLFRYGASPRNLQLLVSLLGDIGQTEAILRVEQDARERGFDPARIRLSRLQALIVARDWREASALADVLSRSKERLTPGEIVLLQTLTFLVQSCLDGASGAKASLLKAITERPGAMKLYRTVIEALLSAGQARTALAVLSFGEGPFPDSRYLTEVRSRVTAQIATEEATEQAAVVRKEEPVTLPDLPALLQSVERLANAGQREEALTLIRRHRRAAPAFFPEKSHELARWEVRLPAEAGDLSQLQLNLRAHLKTGALTSDEVLTLARGWHKAGHTASAHLTVRELLRRDPGHQEALKTWSEWMPKPDPVQPDAADETAGAGAVSAADGR